MSARRKPWLSVAQLLAQAKRPVSKLLPTSRVSQRGLKINPWSVVKALDQPWRRIDHMASKYEADMHHRLLDGVVGWAKGKSIFFPFGFFPDGFGDPSVPVSFATALQAWTSRRARGEPVEALDVTLGPAVPDVENPEVLLQEGTFDTPFEDTSLLPLESHVGRFQLVTPKLWTTVEANSQHPPGSVAATAARRPIAVLLAGTGEHGYTRRRVFMSYALAKAGVASLILESPFYGMRRPPGQRASKLRRVSDLPVLGRVTIEEAQGLVQWLRASKLFGPIALAGTSMGGLHAAISAAFIPYPVGVASYLGPTSAAPVFTEGVLAKACEWKTLASQATHRRLEVCLREFEKKMEGLSPGSIRLYDELDPVALADASPDAKLSLAKRQVDRFLQLTNLTNFPPAVQPDAAVFVVAEHDQYVPRRAMEAHWKTVQERWEGCTVKWIPGGHVSAILFPPESFTEQVLRVLSRLDAAPEGDGTLDVASGMSP